MMCAPTSTRASGTSSARALHAGIRVFEIRVPALSSVPRAGCFCAEMVASAPRRWVSRRDSASISRPHGPARWEAHLLDDSSTVGIRRRSSTSIAGCRGPSPSDGQGVWVVKQRQDAPVISRSADQTLPFRGIEPGLLTRVRGGARVLSADWDALFGEGRLRTLAHAVAARAENESAANSHTTAAALHGLSLYRTRTDRVHLIVPGSHTRKNSRDVIRHHLPLDSIDVDVIDGLRVTTLERTVYDVIRTASLETAVVCFDAALRRVAWDERARECIPSAAGGLRDVVMNRIATNTGARGIRQARFVAGFADGRAQLPGESVSRLWMWQLGMPPPELQWRVDLGAGRFALLDFAWPQLR